MQAEQDTFPDRERFSIVAMAFGTFFMVPSAIMCFLLTNIFWRFLLLASIGVFVAGVVAGRAMIARLPQKFIDELESMEEGVLLRITALMFAAAFAAFVVEHYELSKISKNDNLRHSHVYMLCAMLLLSLLVLKSITKNWGNHSN